MKSTLLPILIGIVVITAECSIFGFSTISTINCLCINLLIGYIIGALNKSNDPDITLRF